MSAGFLSSWLAPGLGCREQLGSSRASLPLIRIPSPLTPTLCFSKILPLEASLVAQMIKNLPAIWETQVWSLGWEDLLEKGMAVHSSVLACEILGIEEPSGLQSVGLQRVGHVETLWCFSPLFSSPLVNVFLLPPHILTVSVLNSPRITQSQRVLCFLPGPCLRPEVSWFLNWEPFLSFGGQLGMSEQVVGCHQWRGLLLSSTE